MIIPNSLGKEGVARLAKLTTFEFIAFCIVHQTCTSYQIVTFFVLSPQRII